MPCAHLASSPTSNHGARSSSRIVDVGGVGVGEWIEVGKNRKHKVIGDDSHN